MYLLQNAAGRPDEYFLCGVFMEASMIDKKVGEKPIHFEISIGEKHRCLLQLRYVVDLLRP